MLSKKNTKAMVAKLQDRKQRFGFRKLTVGLASVLLAVTFMGTTVKADDGATASSEPNTVMHDVALQEARQSTDNLAITSASEASANSANEVADNVATVNSSASNASVTENIEMPASSAVSSNATINDDEAVASSSASTANIPTSSETNNPSSASVSTDIATSPATSSSASVEIDSAANSQVNTVDKVHTDQILKDKYNIDVNHLDAKSVLLLASLFHIFANEANLGADVNGNIAVGILNGGVDFGTRGDSIHLSNGDIYYIQQLAAGLQAGSFRNPEFNHVVFGKDVNVEIKDGQVYVNGQLMNNLKPEEVFKDGSATSYIDFAAVFSRLLNASEFYAQQSNSAGVIVDFNDQNNRFIDISQAQVTDNVIYVNIAYEYLQYPQAIKIFGLSEKTDGPTLVINVTGIPSGIKVINVGTQIQMYYGNDRHNPINNSESHAVPNHTVWNFGSTDAEIKVNSGRFMGSVLAPNATFTANVNVDGNIIANVVNIAGGESHRWDIHPVTPTPEPTPDPDPEPTPDPEPEPTPDPDPEPTPDPDPEPTPDPDPDPTPDPDPEPTPDPDPEPTPDPDPEPTPDPDPEPTPDPDPEPTPDPDPEPTPDPDPEPTPDPDPEPTPDPNVPDGDDTTDDITPPSTEEPSDVTETDEEVVTEDQSSAEAAVAAPTASATDNSTTVSIDDAATEEQAVAESKATELPATGSAKTHLGVAALGILLAMQSLAFALMGRKKEEDE